MSAQPDVDDVPVNLPHAAAWAGRLPAGRGLPVEPAGRAIARHRESIYRRSLVLADALAMGTALVVCFVVLGADVLRPWAALAPLALVIAAKASGMYDRDELVLRRSTVDELPRLAQLAILAVLVAWMGERLLIDGVLGKDQALGFVLVLLGLLAVARWSARKVAARVSPVERCLVVGDPESFERLQGKLAGRRDVELTGLVPLAAVVHDLPALAATAHERQIQRLIIAPPLVGLHEETLNLIRGAKATGLRVSIVPSVLEVVGSAVAFDDLSGLTLLGVKSFGLSRSSKALKRGFDLCGSALAIFVLAPLMFLFAVAIKVETAGPVFFRQTRVGRDGRPFRIMKFRTMVDGAEAQRSALMQLNEAVGGLFKIDRDPRVTRVGRLLRRSCLDELPQLFNVLRGEMSLVGPRPLVVDEDERITGFARQRLLLTPGMTGQWQVAGSARVPFSEMVKIDYLYVATWSLWSDVKLLIHTVPHVLGRRGQ